QNANSKLFTCIVSFAGYTAESVSTKKQISKEQSFLSLLEQISAEDKNYSLKNTEKNIEDSEDSHSEQSTFKEEIDDILSFVPRNYQEEIYIKGVESNIIICLGTGSGKTFIAVLLIRKFALPTFGPFPPAKRIVFLVPTTALVYQQSEYIRRHTGYKVGDYCGESSLNTWSKEKWKYSLEEKNILIMTPEICRQLLQHGIFDITDISLLIFDECHHGVNSGHPYNERIENIEKIYDAKCITAVENLASLKSISSTPKINVVLFKIEENCLLISNLCHYIQEYEQKLELFCNNFFTSKTNFMPIKIDIISMEDTDKNTLSSIPPIYYTSNKIKKIVFKTMKRCLAVIEEFGLYALFAYLKSVDVTICEILKNKIYQEYFLLFEKLKKYIKKLNQFVEFKINHIIELIDVKNMENLCDSNLVSDKLNCLIILLCKHYPIVENPKMENESICATLVFAKERAT
ncbi:hypothetical protein MXB_2748, partial [Myxobolus squamalis]